MKNRRIIPILFIVLFFFGVGYHPRRAHAQIPVTDAGAITFLTQIAASAGATAGSTAGIATEQTGQDIWTQAWNKVVLPAAEGAAKQFALQLIQNLTEATVKWINSGFNGQPTYVADIGGFLANTADQTVGNMLFNDPSLNFLCAPFQLQVKLALGLSYSQPFYKQINCTLSGAINNATNAVNNFTNTVNTDFRTPGGWQNWLSITTQPQNNAIGAFLVARSNLDSQISAKQAAASTELTLGQGALSYMQCDLNTYTPNGNLVSTKHITTSPNYGSSFKSTTDQGGYYTQLDNCEVKTPGSVITQMLGFQATGDARTLELEAALSNGIDTIFQALANELVKSAADQLANGLIGSGAGQYQSNFGQLSQLNVSNYNAALTNTFNNPGALDFTGQLNQYASGFSTGPASATSSTSSMAAAAGISPDDPFYSQKTNGVVIIDNILNFEGQYQAAFATAQNALAAGRFVFANAVACNMKLGDGVSYSRAILINANVVSNIDGATNPSRTVQQIPWNLSYINNSIALSNTHISFLNAASSAIAAATSTDQIAAIMTQVNGTSFGSDQPLANMPANIANWLSQMQIAYTTSQCPIDLSAPTPSPTTATASTSASSTP
ncbi:MAG: hypothetical protein KGH93_00910 [Patescibacteria group bacterium]|nr:hypothetical protein [Patescibacteria group bacterium]